MEYWPEYTRFFTALFVILDPFAAIPIFLSLTQHYSSHERNRASYIAVVTVLIVLMASALLGDAILTGLGTSLASFRVGGGIVLLIMALAMLRAETDKMRTTQDETLVSNIRENIAVVPSLFHCSQVQVQSVPSLLKFIVLTRYFICLGTISDFSDVPVIVADTSPDHTHR